MAKVSVVKCESYDEAEVVAAVKQALKDADFRIPSGKKVLLKPNCLGAFAPDMAITTHPAVLAALIRLFREKDCDVVIGESSGMAQKFSTERAFDECGITKIAHELNVKLMAFEKGRIKQIELKGYKIGIADGIQGYDLIVNVAKLKTHELMKFTGAVKNIFGFVAGARKAYLHSVFHSEEEFAGLLVDLYERITPQLNIIDGVIGLEGNGPGTGGTPKKTGLILASKNAVALDIVASRTIGYDPMSVMTNKIAVERKLVEDNITVVGDNIKVEYQKPKSVRQLLPGFLVKRLSKHHVFYPHILPAKCTKCGICAGVCPQKAIANFVVNRKKCIACYCCQEFCPDHAIDLKMDWLGGTIIKGVMLKRKLSRLFKKPEAQNN